MGVKVWLGDRTRGHPETPPPLECWTGKTGKDTHEHWSKCSFWTGKVAIRTAKAAVRRFDGGLPRHAGLHLRILRNPKTMARAFWWSRGGSSGAREGSWCEGGCGWWWWS